MQTDVLFRLLIRLSFVYVTDILYIIAFNCCYLRSHCIWSRCTFYAHRNIRALASSIGILFYKLSNMYLNFDIESFVSCWVHNNQFCVAKHRPVRFVLSVTLYTSACICSVVCVWAYLHATNNLMLKWWRVRWMELSCTVVHHFVSLIWKSKLIEFANE